MAVFRCTQCGNLHGAPVDGCGLCGSPVVLVQETPNTDRPPPPLGVKGSEAWEERQEELCDALIEFLLAGADWLRAHTPPEEPSDTPRNTDQPEGH